MATSLPVVKHPLHVPPLEELCTVLQKGLLFNFQNVSVKVVDCPDLTEKPFALAAQGICGNPRLADVGGVPYLTPIPQMDKVYDLDTIAQLAELPGAFIIGAGAGQMFTNNCELMPNLVTSSDCTHGDNQTVAAMICPDAGILVMKQYPNKKLWLMGNLLASEGKPGKVMEIKASVRKGQNNFVTQMRETLAQHYGDQPVGLGGTFIIESGKAKLHVMPAYSQKPLDTPEDVDQWLKFREVDAPLVCLSVFISKDPGLALRVEHTHCFRQTKEGGHYHYDTTPQEISYRGYYVPAEYMYRIDRPPNT